MKARNIIEWLKNNYEVVFFWRIIISVSPVFIEVLLVADILGTEVAIGLLILLYKELKENWGLRVHQFKQQVSSVFSIVQNHPICQSNIYIGHCAASFLIVVLGGTFAYSVIVWYPIDIFGNNLV